MRILSIAGRRGWVAAALLVLVACGTPPESTTVTDPESTAAAVPASPTPTPTLRNATVVMNGDLLWHNTLVFDAQRAAGGGGLDFVPLLEGVRPIVEPADMAICHNEVPVAPPGGPYRYYPSFRAPVETLDAVREIGYDMCTTASNHSLDDGWSGLVRTLDALDERGILPAGTARTEEEAEQPRIFTTDDGVRIAVVTGTYGTNGIPRPADRAWSVPDLDADTMLRKAATARAEGADIVLAAIHGGDEYAHQPNAEQTELAEVLTASPDVDLVYGHHVHVVQPFTKVNDKWVAYGLGNLVAQHLSTVPAGYEGVTARFTFTEEASGQFVVAEAEFIPTLITPSRPGSPARLLLVNEALEAGAGDQQRLITAVERTRRVVHSLGGTEDLKES